MSEFIKAATSEVTHFYETKVFGYYTTTSSAVYLPITGYTLEGTSNVGQNERYGMIAPYNGTIEKIMWRSEILHSGNIRMRIMEASDGTELPGTEIGQFNIDTGSIADDVTVEVIAASHLTSSNVLTKGRLYGITVNSNQVAGSYDTNVTVVFKWDVTT